MSNSTKCLFTSLVLLFICTFIIGGCSSLTEKAPTEFKFKYAGVGTFHLQSHTGPGLYTISDGRLEHVLDSFLNVINVKKNIAVTAKIDSVIFIIPDSLNVDFSDYKDLKLVIKNFKPTAATFVDSVTIPFADTTGKRSKLVSLPGELDKTYDISSVVKSPNLAMLAYYRTKRATPYLTMNIKYSFVLSYKEDPY